MFKTNTCGELRKEHIGNEVTLAGWVNRRRDHGGLIFIDLRDKEGIVQIVFNPESSTETMQKAGELRSEYVIKVTGKVALRPAGTENVKIATGGIEVIIREIEILNTSKTPPFYINEEVEVDESLRLKYRYLDIRRSRMKENLMLRHRVSKFMHDYLDARGFTEVETPIFVKSTPEGARDYLVPSDNLLNKRPKKLLLLIISVSMSKAGKSLKAPGSLKHIEVFPTHVGVNRPWDSGPRPPQCILHAYTR